MARKKTVSAREDARRGSLRFVDQKGQLQDRTPASVKARQKKDWQKLEDSLTPEQRKKFGLKPKKTTKKK